MNTQFAYKLVNAAKPEVGLRSFIPTRSDALIYRVGRWTRPKPTALNQFLFVFRTRAQARAYRKTRYENPKLRIFRCQVENMNDFREGQSQAGHSFNVFNNTWPKGTAFVDAVKLLHRD